MKSVLMILVACFGLNTWAAGATYTSGSNSSATLPPFNATLSDTPIYVIPTLGVAATQLRSSDGSTGGDTGMSIGGLLDFGRHSLTLETGLLYNQFGGKTGSNQINVSYISIPTLAKWNMLGTQEKTVYFKGGFLTSILTSAEMKTDGGTVNGSDLGAKTLDFGLLLGVGGTYPIASNTSLVMDIGYLRGLTTVSDKFNASFRNEGFIFSSGVSIAL